MDDGDKLNSIGTVGLVVILSHHMRFNIHRVFGGHTKFFGWHIR